MQRVKSTFWLFQHKDKFNFLDLAWETWKNVYEYIVKKSIQGYVHSSSLVFAEVLLYLGDGLDLPSPIPANKNTQVFLENVSIIYIPLILYIIPELYSLFLGPCYHTFLITSHSRIGRVRNHASILTPYTLEICLVKKKKEEKKE